MRKLQIPTGDGAIGPSARSGSRGPLTFFRRLFFRVKVYNMKSISIESDLEMNNPKIMNTKLEVKTLSPPKGGRIFIT